MPGKILLVSLVGAITRLEAFPGEIFDEERFDHVGLSYQEFLDHGRAWSHPVKICVMHFVNERCPDLDLSAFDLIVVLDEEAINLDPRSYLQRLAAKFSNHNIKIITSGYDRSHSIDSNVYIYPFFLVNVARLSNIKIIDPVKNHRKKFDVLLGMKKLHRQWIFEELAAHRMLEDCYVNLTTNRFHDTLRTIYRSPELWAVEETSVAARIDHVLDSYDDSDFGPRISHIVPWTIYDTALYSIIAETNWEDHVFFSEKTAKALLAKRIFVFFGTENSLDQLRHWGFRTFDQILDESYDGIKDTQERMQAAWQQVMILYHMDPAEIFQKAQPILDHNQRHLQNRDYFLRPLVMWIHDCINAAAASKNFDTGLEV